MHHRSLNYSHCKGVHRFYLSSEQHPELIIYEATDGRTLFAVTPDGRITRYDLECTCNHIKEKRIQGIRADFERKGSRRVQKKQRDINVTVDIHTH